MSWTGRTTATTGATPTIDRETSTGMAAGVRTFRLTVEQTSDGRSVPALFRKALLNRLHRACLVTRAVTR